jgi:hypothetical protein
MSIPHTCFVGSKATVVFRTNGNFRRQPRKRSGSVVTKPYRSCPLPAQNDTSASGGHFAVLISKFLTSLGPLVAERVEFNN